MSEMPPQTVHHRKVARSFRCPTHSLSMWAWGVQAGRVMMRLWASFLNNSSSRWEPIWENWPLHMEIMDIVSPIYRSDFQRQGSLSSLKPLLDATD